MTADSISTRVDEFNEGFTAQIGPVLTAVFDDEQTALRTAGIPADVVSVGSVLPEATLRTPQGAEVALTAALDGAPAVIVFYRGAWCPYCNITLRAYQDQLLPILRDRGIQLAAISPQTPEASEQAVANGSLEFTVLSDPGNKLARELGIVTEPTAEARKAHTELGFDVADSNADATGDIPFPTVLVVDADGTVVFADIRVDYTTRTEVADIVEATDLLRAAA